MSNACYFHSECKTKQRQKTLLGVLFLTVLPFLSHWPELSQAATPGFKGGWESRNKNYRDADDDLSSSAGWWEEMDVDNVAIVSVVPICWKAEWYSGSSTEFRVRDLWSCPTSVVSWLAVWPYISQIASLSQFPYLSSWRNFCFAYLSVIIKMDQNNPWASLHPVNMY